MHITHLESNITSLRGRVFPLSKRTAITGPLRSGKTSVLNAIELAVFHTLPGMSTAAKFLELAPANAHELFARLYMTDAATITADTIAVAAFEAAIKTKKRSGDEALSVLSTYCNEAKIDRNSFPMRAFVADTFGPQRLRNLVLRRWKPPVKEKRDATGNIISPTDADLVPMPDALDADQAREWGTTFKIAAVNYRKEAAREQEGDDPIVLDPIEVISSMYKMFDEQLRNQNARAGVIESDIKRHREAIAELCAGSEDLERLEREYLEAVAFEGLTGMRQQLLNAQQLVATLKTNRDTAKTAIETAKANIAAVEKDAQKRMDEATALEGAVPSYATAKADVDRLEAGYGDLGKLVDLTKRAAVKKPKKCAMCSLGGELVLHVNGVDVTHTIEHDWDRRSTEIGGQYEKKRVEVATAKAALQKAQSEQSSQSGRVRALRDSATQLRSSAQRALSEAEQRLASIERELTSAESSVATLEKSIAAVKVHEGESAEQLKARIDKLKKGRVLQEEADKKMIDLAKVRAGSTIARTLKRESEVMKKRLIDEVKIPVERDVNARMPEGFGVELDLIGQGCQFNIVGADKRAHSKLTSSGSERRSLKISLALAAAEPSVARILLLEADDHVAAFNDENGGLDGFVHFLDELVDSGEIDQVIMTWPRPSDFANREGWSMVDLTPSNVVPLKSSPARRVFGQNGTAKES